MRASLEDILIEFLGTGLISDATVAQSEALRHAFWVWRDAVGEITLDGESQVTSDIALPLGRLSDFLGMIEDPLTGRFARASSLFCAHLGHGNIHYIVRLARHDGRSKSSCSS